MMNNTITLYLSSRLDRLSLEKDEPISSLQSKISTEWLNCYLIIKSSSIPNSANDHRQNSPIYM